MKRTAVFFLVLILSAQLTALTISHADANSKTKVANKVALKVLVNGEKIAYEALGDHPAELFDIEYPLPLQLTRGKDRLTVKFQARIDSTAGGVFDVRVVQ